MKKRLRLILLSVCFALMLCACTANQAEHSVPTETALSEPVSDGSSDAGTEETRSEASFEETSEECSSDMSETVSELSGDLSIEVSADSSSDVSSADGSLAPVVSSLPKPLQDADFLQFVAERFGQQCITDLLSAAERDGYSDGLWRTYTGNSVHVLLSLYRNEPETLPNVRLLRLGERGERRNTTMVFGGDICFADNYLTLPYMLANNLSLAECISQPYFDLFRNADIAMLNNEFTISERGEPMSGKMYTFRAKPEHTQLYRDMGIDFVTLGNNHAYDFGRDAFLDTMDTLSAYGIDYAGGGRNAEEAQRPFYYLIDGRKIAFVSATRAEKHIMTPEAGKSSPGVFRCYDPERLTEVLAEAKAQSDYVVLFVHWGTEKSTVLEDVQVTTARQYIDAGADLIIGGHAHNLQGIDFYKGKAIFYNLGNFWFDDATMETAAVELILDADGEETFRFHAGMTEACRTTYALGTDVGRGVLDRVQSYSKGRVAIDDDGTVHSVG